MEGLSFSLCVAGHTSNFMRFNACSVIRIAAVISSLLHSIGLYIARTVCTHCSVCVVYMLYMRAGKKGTINLRPNIWSEQKLVPTVPNKGRNLLRIYSS